MTDNFVPGSETPKTPDPAAPEISSISENQNNREKSEAGAETISEKEGSTLFRTTSFPTTQKRKLERQQLNESSSPNVEKHSDIDSTLYRSKSSLWSVSSAPSSVLNSKKNQTQLSRSKINSPLSQPHTATPKSQIGLIAELNKCPSARNSDVVASVDNGSRSYPLTMQPASYENLQRERTPCEKRNALSEENYQTDSKLRRSTNLHQDLPVDFDNIIAEPVGYQTPKFSWNLSHEVYDFTKRCCYTVITLFCAIPCAFLWGIWFSILTCCNVWLCYPLKKSSEINIACFKAIWTQLISCFCDPLCQSSGMVFSNIKVRKEKHIV